MPLVSVTRLRIRSVRFLPAFAVHMLRSRAQVRHALGFAGGSLLADRSWVFWTMTLWDSEASMRGYTNAGPHRAAMARLAAWCDEASVVHWSHADPILPSWGEADRRMRTEGRPSKVRHPSPVHASLAYPAPRTAGAVSIPPAAIRPAS